MRGIPPQLRKFTFVIHSVLIGSMKRRIPGDLQTRLDPEDIVQSVFREVFFAGRQPVLTMSPRVWSCGDCSL